MIPTELRPSENGDLVDQASKKFPPQAAGLSQTQAMHTGTIARPLSSEARRSEVAAEHRRRDLVAHGTSPIALFPAVSTPQPPLAPWARAHDGRALTRVPRGTPGARASRRSAPKSWPWPDALPALHWCGPPAPPSRPSALAPAGVRAWHDSAPGLRRPDPGGQGILAGRGSSADHAAMVPPSPAVWQRASRPLPHARIPPRRTQRGSLSAFRAA